MDDRSEERINAALDRLDPVIRGSQRHMVVFPSEGHEALSELDERQDLHFTEDDGVMLIYVL
jgi:hypothetical protein